MNAAYWDAVAADYDGAVLSVFDHDAAGLVRSRIVAAARAAPAGQAADLGCGVGKFTSLLAENFLHVQACDRSARGLAGAGIRCRERPNITFSCFDLAHDPAPFAPVEFVLCVNVLIMPSLDERLRAWRAVCNQIALGGTLVLVVPSLESVHYGYFAALDAALLAGGSCAESLRRTTSRAGSIAEMQHGVHALDGVRTKHYLREELEQMLPAHECEIDELVKLDYPASSPASWDWLVTARRRI
jgi:SAM-dependent methyltransferase